MVASWALTEVVRYLFYAMNNPLVAGEKNTPHFMKVARYACLSTTNLILTLFCRYSMFLVLYPSGILGELGVLFSWARAAASPLNYAIYAIMAVYAPGSPVMYSHMMAQRRKTLRAETKSE